MGTMFVESKTVDKEIVKKTLKKLKDGEFVIDGLDFNEGYNRKAVAEFIKTAPRRLIPSLKSQNEKMFLEYAIYCNPELFPLLREDQHTELMATAFIAFCLGINLNPTGEEDKKEKVIVTNDNFSYKLSYDNKIILTYKYKTMAGEEIRYFDEHLRVPASIIDRLIVSFKINNSLQFIKELDTDLYFLNENHINQEMVYVIQTSFRMAMLDVLKENGMDFYKASVAIDKIEDKFNQNVKKRFHGESVELADVNIVNISLNGDIEQMLEEQAIANYKDHLDLEFEMRYQSESLDLFAKKAEIVAKNPTLADQLTEAEKDKAFDRYLLKNGREKNKGSFELKRLDSRNYDISSKARTIAADQAEKIKSFFAICNTTWWLINVFLVIILPAYYLYLGYWLISLKICGTGLILSGLFRIIFNERIVVEKETLKMIKAAQEESDSEDGE